MSNYTTDDSSTNSETYEQRDYDKVMANNLKMKEMNKIKNYQRYVRNYLFIIIIINLMFITSFIFLKCYVFSPVNIIKGNIFRKKDKDYNYESTDSITDGKIISENDVRETTKYSKSNSNDHQIIKDDYEIGSDHKYCSDESTQENGSNTESAENLLCNCTKQSSKNDVKKKSVTEKSIQTSSDVLKSRTKVPVYILYPNYSLPNLEFLKKEHYVQNLDFSKIFIRPQQYQTPSSKVSSPKNTPRRPFSVNDIETLKRTGFKHVKDWESLTFLLPKEYKQFLQEIPEIVSHIKEVKNINEELVPLFCLSPPPNRKIKKRPMSCEINFFNNDHRNSNFSSTATQPSSGYRGSSTMLYSNNSSCAGSPRNPSCGYKYDCSSESGSLRKSANGSKHYSKTSSESSSTRPPLPKGILRNNSLDNHQYTCKTQKENANKRYSMTELTDQNVNAEEKSVRRRSSSNLPSHQRLNSNKNNQTGTDVGSKSDKLNKGNKSQGLNESYFSKEQSKVQNDLRRLEELLEISAVFSENVESFTENDMLKLRSQVSKFLTMHKNLEKVSETLQTVDKTSGYENCYSNVDNNQEENQSLEEKRLNTPHNTPEHKKQIKTGSEKDLKGESNYARSDSGENSPEDYENYGYLDEEIGGMKKTVSFAERISFAVKEREKENGAVPLNSPCSAIINQKLQEVFTISLFTSFERLIHLLFIYILFLFLDKK